jgi:hypothetical protein
VLGEHRLDLFRSRDLAAPDCCERFVDFARSPLVARYVTILTSLSMSVIAGE